MEPEQIKQLLESGLAESRAEVSDMTGGGDHFEITVVAPAFGGLSLLERHRLVYKLLNVAGTEEIHALTLKTYTAEEWAKV
ncbi:MAG: BolA/IbaG family iron-sulfur metabolism protein [Candidatus Wallbacteria bacterium]|nr:BolA/IbaG family iron-sulfur metabolism protein [Candidatus Wallbacteria bacterium]